jgi:dethiobiotin synthetase
VSIVVVTGTNTDVGKTVVTAAVATLAATRGTPVAVVKPAQTGVAAGEPGDLDEVRRLVGDRPGLTTVELARYPDPLAPATAAARAGMAPLTMSEVADAVTGLSVGHELVLVEGAGGLLVPLAPTFTLVDLAVRLAAPVLVVTSAGLGTLNHTALTTEALAARNVRCAGIVIGAWPGEPDLAAECNLADLPAVAGAPLLGRLPSGAGRLAPGAFLLTARAELGPASARLA